MSNKIHSFFKVAKNSKQMSFGAKSLTNFNFVDFGPQSDKLLESKAQLVKQMHDSYLLEIEKDPKYGKGYVIPELKLTNQDIMTWEDYWIDAKSKALIDPQIKKINLQKNRIIHANFNLTRDFLVSLNLEGNTNMQAIFLYEAPQLEVLNLSNCPSLQVINLGKNKSIKALLARNCQLSSTVQEKLLRDFTPTTTSSSNSAFNMFRKTYSTLVDLRGSEIDWGNRLIASKIRLLLCNNWLVLWDNPPPASIIPPQMYAFFTNNLEDSLIKDYYLG